MSEVKFCILCGSELTEKNVDGKSRRACSAQGCHYVFWDNPIPVVAAIIIHDEKIILARNKAWPEKVFGLITGFLEKDETPEQGVIREVKEELGLEGQSLNFIGLYSIFQFNQLLIAYEVTATGLIALGDEIAEVRKVEPSKLKPWPFGTGFVVKDWIDKRGY